MSKSKKVGAVAVAGLAAAAVSVPTMGVAGASHHHHAKPKAPKIKVGDDYFAPTSQSVKKGSKIKFKWDSSNTDSHNVTLTNGPKHVKKSDFKSATGSIGVKFNPKFQKPGTYNFICTIHPDTMKLTVKVKR